uniref:Uncharacterized protein n=1 Tax=Zea mays TaxID=4577 RepID=C4J0U8_MAIZE|nr:unknown [Zea mays]ACR38632.1 unknown [Zea mays]
MVVFCRKHGQHAFLLEAGDRLVEALEDRHEVHPQILEALVGELVSYHRRVNLVLALGGYGVLREELGEDAAEVAAVQGALGADVAAVRVGRLVHPDVRLGHVPDVHVRLRRVHVGRGRPRQVLHHVVRAGVHRRLQQRAQHQHRVHHHQVQPSLPRHLPRALLRHRLGVAVPVLGVLAILEVAPAGVVHRLAGVTVGVHVHGADGGREHDALHSGVCRRRHHVARAPDRWLDHHLRVIGDRGGGVEDAVTAGEGLGKALWVQQVGAEEDEAVVGAVKGPQVVVLWIHRVPDRAADCVALLQEALDEPGGNEPSSSGHANRPPLPGGQLRRHGRRRLCCWHPS